MAKLNLPKIEKKWQRRWEKAKLYQTKDKIKKGGNFYHLVMFPYPSGDLHIGHWFSFAPADIYARFKEMQGYNVLSPIGFDAFGLPAENAAIKRNIHPAKWTFQNIEKMREQIKTMGPMYDWSREIITCEPAYYKWTQWMFLQIFKAGLAQRRKTWANWCPSCKTVLANEQVVAGLCERCETEVIQKQIDQWVFKITEYAERLLRDLDKLDWPERTKTMQKNWIGRSEGAVIQFPISNFQFPIVVFTTRQDTIFGATYLVVAPEHPIIKNLEFGIWNLEEVQKYIENALKKTPRERQMEQKEKTGVELKGVKAINPAINEEIPIWVADYVLSEYGTGAVMGVPGHDERDFEFATKFSLPIVHVIKPYNKSQITNSKSQINHKSQIPNHKQIDKAYEGEGTLINSGQFDGMASEKAREEIVKWLGEKGFAKSEIQYKLRDWIVSRQRYWGAPIPLVFCENCKNRAGISNFQFPISSKARNKVLPEGQVLISKGERGNPGWIPVPERNLPVLLPNLKDFKPTGTGESPLAKSREFVNVKCPKCKGEAKRETDTMDTFVDSSWYFLRYSDSRNRKEFASKEKMRRWLPVNIYIGGAEHTVLHLLYSRFFIKVLFDLGYLHFNEPFLKLRHQGTILGPDGQKMSKSRGNVIAPDQLVKQYGADVVRMYLAFLGPYEQGGPWSAGGINGITRFLERVYRIITKATKIPNSKFQIPNSKIQKLIHKTIKKVVEDLEELKFNTAISALMVLVNEMQKNLSQLPTPKENLRFPTGQAANCQLLLLLLAPFAPHLAEELWFKLGHKKSIHLEQYPGYDKKLVEEEMVTIIVQVNGKLRGKIEAPVGTSENEAKSYALADAKISQWIQTKPIKKVIFVADRLINFVI